MKIKVFLIGLFLFGFVGWVAQAGGVSQEEEYYYEYEFKNREITNIEYQMEHHPLGYVLLRNTEDAIEYYRDIMSLWYTRVPEKKFQIRENDIRQTWSKYEEWINENNKIVKERGAVRRAKAAEANKLYDEGKLDAKHIPFRFHNDFTKEQQNKLISSIIGIRAIFKSEWDLMWAQYYMQKSRAVGDWYASIDIIDSDEGKDKFRNVLNWLVLQEALWYFGYINRFVEDMEYTMKLQEILNERKGLIVDFEVYYE